ncbi:MAG: endolytic transglycosylase MltG [Patescibacteria group bacterium]|nr:endolytic transglycosylase MltG [Patescibacteria group bacterium]
MKKSLLPYVVAITVTAILSGLAFYKVWERGRNAVPAEITVTIPEGDTVSQINQRLLAAGVLNSGNLLPQSAEGYLFPDTYQFYAPSSLMMVENKFESDFNGRVLPLLSPGVDLKKTITIASLIQDEAKNQADMNLVSGIIWKRLQAGMPLQIDSTICYIKKTTPCLPITKADLNIDSPYNTYLNKGLPPGPIDNPGLEAVAAALHPKTSAYWYYLSVPGSGNLVFAATLDEQDRNIVKYLK